MESRTQAHSTSQPKSNSSQSNRSRGTNKIRSCSKPLPPWSWSIRGIEVVKVNSDSAALWNNFIPNKVNRQSINKVGRAPFYRMCLPQLHKAWKTPLISEHLQAKFKSNWIVTLEMLQQRKPLPHEPKYGHSSPSSPSSKVYLQQRSSWTRCTTIVKSERRTISHQIGLQQNLGPTDVRIVTW